jgi:hypothetical protein
VARGSWDAGRLHRARGEEVGQVMIGGVHRRGSPSCDPGKKHAERHAGDHTGGGPSTPTYTTSRDVPQRLSLDSPDSPGGPLCRK